MFTYQAAEETGAIRKSKYIDQQHAGRSEAHHWLAGQHTENSL